MTTEVPPDYPERIVDALNGLAEHTRNELVRQHADAYRVLSVLRTGLVRNTGVSAAGSAALDQLALALRVDRNRFAAPMGIPTEQPGPRQSEGDQAEAEQLGQREAEQPEKGKRPTGPGKPNGR